MLFILFVCVLHCCMSFFQCSPVSEDMLCVGSMVNQGIVVAIYYVGPCLLLHPNVI